MENENTNTIKSPGLYVRLNPELNINVRELAVEEQRNLSNMLEILIEQGYKIRTEKNN